MSNTEDGKEVEREDLPEGHYVPGDIEPAPISGRVWLPAKKNIDKPQMTTGFVLGPKPTELTDGSSKKLSDVQMPDSGLSGVEDMVDANRPQREEYLKKHGTLMAKD